MEAIDRARAIFDGALALAKDDREAWIRAECRGDAVLYDMVRGVIAEFEAAVTIDPPVGAGGPSPRAGALLDIGSMVGPYRIVRKLGTGGFGEVFLADQTKPVKRPVALKVIKPGMHSPEVLKRFDGERQALAVMTHDHVAKVFDAGTTEQGLPYFVMEYVEGKPITAYCDDKRLTLEDRLRLFIPVCEAVQHAHSKGIIHRDIKPSNILVAEVDGKPSVKVIDFGIAKALDQSTLEQTEFTERGLIIGSPEYMSPEQASAGETDVDTRSDVYSLGAVLYELLTGLTPFDPKALRSRGWTAMLRMIREDHPPSPSTRLLHAGDLQSQVAAARATEVGALAGTLKRELEWIPQMAMRKERDRRYASPAELALDADNYLNHRPLIAAPESTVYRVGKFVRRHRVPVGAAVAIALALTAALAVSFAAWSSEAEQRRVAVQERDSAEAIAHFMSKTLEGAGPSVAGNRDSTMLREMMDIAADKITSGELRATPAAEVRLRVSIGDTYRLIGAFDKAEGMLGPATELSRSLYPGDHTDAADALNSYGLLLQELGDLPEAESLFRAATEMWKRLYPGDHAYVAAGLNNLGKVLSARGDRRGAEEVLIASVDMQRRLSGDEHDLAGAMINLAYLLRDRGDLDGAERLFREALAMRRRLYPGDHPRVAIALAALATIVQVRGDLAATEDLLTEALDMSRRLYPPDHPNILINITNLGQVLQRGDDPERAEPLLREALEGFRRAYPGDHQHVAAAATALGVLLLERGRSDEAEPLFREALAMDQRLRGDHPDVATDLSNLARLLELKGELPEAEAMSREAVAMMRRLTPNDPSLATALKNLGSIREARGDHADAEPLYREALETRRRVFGDASQQVANAMGALASCLSEQAWNARADDVTIAGAQAKAAEAESLLRACLDRQLAAGTHVDWTRANAQSALGGAIVATVACDRTAGPEARVQRLREVEPMLLAAEQNLELQFGQNPTGAQPVNALRRSKTRLLRLYTLWDEIEPEAGMAKKAAGVRERLGAGGGGNGP